MSRLVHLRAEQIFKAQCAEIDALIEFSLARIPLQVRQMTVWQLETEGDKDIVQPLYEEISTRKQILSVSSSCQTPTYTARKRSREDFENAELVGKIKAQLHLEPQHIILPTAMEFGQLAGPKKSQIVNILGAIISTYENLDADLGN